MSLVLELSLPEYIGHSYPIILEASKIVVEGHVVKNRNGGRELPYNTEEEWRKTRQQAEERGWYKYKSKKQEAVICLERVSGLEWQATVMENANITSRNTFAQAICDVIKIIKEHPDKYRKCTMF